MSATNALHTGERDQQVRRLPTLFAERAAVPLQVRRGQRARCCPQRPVSSVEGTLPSPRQSLQVGGSDHHQEACAAEPAAASVTFPISRSAFY